MDEEDCTAYVHGSVVGDSASTLVSDIKVKTESEFDIRLEFSAHQPDVALSHQHRTDYIKQELHAKPQICVSEMGLNPKMDFEEGHNIVPAIVCVEPESKLNIKIKPESDVKKESDMKEVVVQGADLTLSPEIVEGNIKQESDETCVREAITDSLTELNKDGLGLASTKRCIKDEPAIKLESENKQPFIFPTQQNIRLEPDSIFNSSVRIADNIKGNFLSEQLGVLGKSVTCNTEKNAVEDIKPENFEDNAEMETLGKTNDKSLEKNISTHTENNQYKCEKCEKVFSTGTCLKTHMLSHCYRCDECNIGFISQSILKRHTLKRHTKGIHNKEKKAVTVFKPDNFENNAEMEALGKTCDKPLEKHIITHTESHQYRCKKCEKVFSTGTCLKTHMLSHYYQCDECNIGFISLSILERHILKRHILKNTIGITYECNKCRKRFTSKYCLMKHNIETHRQIHTAGDRHREEQSGRPENTLIILPTGSTDDFGEIANIENETASNIYSKKQTMANTADAIEQFGVPDNTLIISPKGSIDDYVEKQNIVGETTSSSKKQTISNAADTAECLVHMTCKSYDCELCEKKFGNISDLGMHYMIHTGVKPYKCKQCGKSFTQKSNLKVHILTHTGDKPHKCERCGKGFIARKSLMAHISAHTGEKPYKCEECDKAFVQRARLKLHLLTHTGDYPHKCEECGKGFRDHRSLMAHISAHTGEKQYKCKACEKYFSHQSSLKRHIKLIHIGEKPHKCEECGKGFSWPTGLNAHLKKHTGETPYECKVCEKGFSTKPALKRHCKAHLKESI